MIELQPSITTFDPDMEYYLHLRLSTGNVRIKLHPEVAPKHVSRIIDLVNRKYYNGKTFHRVIPGFMAQCGSKDGDGNGGTGKLLNAEFNDMPHVRGTVSMARASDPNSADCQFFICYNEVPSLNRQYTVFGTVVSGMEAVDYIKPGMGGNGMVIGVMDYIVEANIGIICPAK